MQFGWMVLGGMWWSVGTARADETACLDGQEAVHRGRECCWAGQHWDRRRKQCGGVPRSCPEGWSVVVPVPANSGPPECVDLKSGGARHTALQASEDTRGFLDGSLDPEGTLVGAAPPTRTASPDGDARAPGGVIAPGLLHDRPTVTGPVSPDQLQRSIRAQRELFAACLDLLQVERPGAGGTVTVTLRADGAGRVTDVAVQSDTLGHAPTAQCFSDVFLLVTLPRNAGGVEATWPFVIQP